MLSLRSIKKNDVCVPCPFSFIFHFNLPSYSDILNVLRPSKLAGECSLTWKGGNIKTRTWRGKIKVPNTIIILMIKSFTFKKWLFKNGWFTDIWSLPFLFKHERILIVRIATTNFHLRGTSHFLSYDLSPHLPLHSAVVLYSSYTRRFVAILWFDHNSYRECQYECLIVYDVFLYMPNRLISFCSHSSFRGQIMSKEEIDCFDRVRAIDWLIVIN